jgi:hypothetical protein
LERKRRIPGPLGGLVDATEVGHRATGEYWNEYLLDDGTVLRFKAVVTNAYRVDGMYTDEGEPVYWIKSNNIVSISAPDELLRPEGGPE